MLAAAKAMVLKRHIYVNINGKKCPVLGHVGMLHTAVDVTKAAAKPGDKAVMEINPLQVRGMEIEFR